MKIIFLDIDGPMLPSRARVLRDSTTKGQLKKFDPIATAMILKFLSIGDIRLVISSSWRHCGKQVIIDLLSFNGISPDFLHDDWKTISIYNNAACPEGERAEEILTWLKNHPEITVWVAIDDLPLPIDNLIQASYTDGISFENYLDMQRLLKIGRFPI